ncbi:MAG: ECF transporter S component [Clostridia bacterium]
MKRLTLRQVVLAGILGSLIAALGFTPMGMIPVPTPAGSATILHVPVILGALLEGPAFGAAVGFLFGAVSFWRALVAPANPVAQMMFTDPFTAFVPRILIGLAAYYAFGLAQHRWGRLSIAGLSGLLVWDLSYRVALNYELVAGPMPGYVLFLPFGVAIGWLVVRILSGDGAPVVAAAVSGSLVNTVGVLGLVVLRGIIPLPAAAVVAVVHGIPEAVAAAVLTLLLYGILRARRAV